MPTDLLHLPKLFRTPMVGKNGLLRREWQDFFIQLNLRTGASETFDSEDLETAVMGEVFHRRKDYQGLIAALEKLLESSPASPAPKATEVELRRLLKSFPTSATEADLRRRVEAIEARIQTESLESSALGELKATVHNLEASLVGEIFGTDWRPMLLYNGACYGDHIAWSQAAAVQNTWYNISDADMADGNLHGVAHDGSGKLTVLHPGLWLFFYTSTVEASAANVHLELGFEKNGGGSAETLGIGHVQTKVANSEFNVTSFAALTLATDDTIELAVRTIDATTPNLTVDNLHILGVILNMYG